MTLGLSIFYFRSVRFSTLVPSWYRVFFKPLTRGFQLKRNSMTVPGVNEGFQVVSRMKKRGVPSYVLLHLTWSWIHPCIRIYSVPHHHPTIYTSILVHSLQKFLSRFSHLGFYPRSSNFNVHKPLKIQRIGFKMILTNTTFKTHTDPVSLHTNRQR